MAPKTISTSSYQLQAFKLLGLFSLMLLLQKGNAIQLTVGGAKGWGVSDAANYNEWAEKTRFQIGDSLVFVYEPDQDSVLQVTKENFEKCNPTAALATYDDGHTVLTLNKSGPHYFISGKKENCLKDEKLAVIVLADRSNRSANINITSPPPSGGNGVVPSSAPGGEGAPPAGDISPTPSPAEPNAASSTFICLVGSMGAFFASSLILVL